MNLVIEQNEEVLLEYKNIKSNTCVLCHICFDIAHITESGYLIERFNRLDSKEWSFYRTTQRMLNLRSFIHAGSAKL
jgi:hypothetical protein